MSSRPGFLYPKSPVKFGFWSRATAFVKLLGFLGLVLVILGLASVGLRNVLDTGESDDDQIAAGTPTTIVGGAEVPLMQLPACGDDADCDERIVLVGNDEYVLNVDPQVLVEPANVTDTLFAAGEIGGVDRAYIVENVDPAVLLAGRSGSSFFAITGPLIEATVTEPTIEVLFTVCVSITDVSAYDKCAILG